MEKIVRQVGHLPELHEDARSEKYKIYAVNTEILSWTFKLSSKQELYRIFSMMRNRSSEITWKMPVFCYNVWFQCIRFLQTSPGKIFDSIRTSKTELSAKVSALDLWGLLNRILIIHCPTSWGSQTVPRMLPLSSLKNILTSFSKLP